MAAMAAMAGAASFVSVPSAEPEAARESGTASTYTVTNTGGIATSALMVATSDAEFAIGSDLCSGVSLATVGTCTFTVTFRPTSAGVKAAVLSAYFGGTALAAIQIQATGLPVAADAGP